MNIGGRAEAKIQLFRNMVMFHIKFKGTTYTVTWKQICAAIFKSFIKIDLILLLKLPPGRFKFLEDFGKFKLKVSQNWFYAISRFKGLT